MILLKKKIRIDVIPVFIKKYRYPFIISSFRNSLIHWSKIGRSNPNPFNKFIYFIKLYKKVIYIILISDKDNIYLLWEHLYIYFT